MHCLNFLVFSQAKTWGDVSGIGIHESRLALETVRERVPWRVFDSALAWLVRIERRSTVHYFIIQIPP